MGIIEFVSILFYIQKKKVDIKLKIRGNPLFLVISQILFRNRKIQKNYLYLGLFLIFFCNNS